MVVHVTDEVYIFAFVVKKDSINFQVAFNFDNLNVVLNFLTVLRLLFFFTYDIIVLVLGIANY